MDISLPTYYWKTWPRLDFWPLCCHNYDRFLSHSHRKCCGNELHSIVFTLADHRHPQWDDHVRISRVHVKLTVAGNSHLSRDDSHVWFRAASYQLDHVTGGPGRAGFELSSPPNLALPLHLIPGGLTSVSHRGKTETRIGTTKMSRYIRFVRVRRGKTVELRAEWWTEWGETGCRLRDEEGGGWEM